MLHRKPAIVELYNLQIYSLHKSNCFAWTKRQAGRSSRPVLYSGCCWAPPAPPDHRRAHGHIVARPELAVCVAEVLIGTKGCLLAPWENAFFFFMNKPTMQLQQN